MTHQFFLPRDINHFWYLSIYCSSKGYRGQSILIMKFISILYFDFDRLIFFRLWLWKVMYSMYPWDVGWDNRYNINEDKIVMLKEDKISEYIKMFTLSFSIPGSSYLHPHMLGGDWGVQCYVLFHNQLVWPFLFLWRQLFWYFLVSYIYFEIEL